MGQGIGIAVPYARVVLNVRVICVEVGQPAGQHVIGVSEPGKPYQRGIVCANHERASVQVFAEFSDRGNDRYQLTQRSTIALLGFMECLRSIRDNTFLPIDEVGENGPHSLATSVCVEYVGCGWMGKG